MAAYVEFVQHMLTRRVFEIADVHLALTFVTAGLVESPSILVNMGFLFLRLAFLVAMSSIGHAGYVELIHLAQTIYSLPEMTTVEAVSYLTNVQSLLQTDVNLKGEFLADFLIEVSHITDFIVSKLEERTDNPENDLVDIGSWLVNITELQMKGISHVTCRPGQTVGCTLSGIKAVPLVNATEECLLRILLLIVSSPTISEVTISGHNMSAIATQVPMYAVTTRPRICNILSIPALNDDATTIMPLSSNVYIFVLSSRTNMYAFLDENTDLNAGTVRSFARDFEGRILEIFQEINLFIEAMYNPSNQDPNGPRNNDDFNVTSNFQSDTDGGAFTITLATLQMCTTHVNDPASGIAYQIKTQGLDDLLQDTSPNTTHVTFVDQTLTLVLIPPINPMEINVLCESCMQKADIVFLADSSGSVGALNFVKILVFMSSLVRRLDIGPDRVRIGLVTFGHGAQFQFHLDTYNTTDNITNAIDEVVYDQGSFTQTHLGLEYVRLNMFTPEITRDGVQKLLIVITDGKSTDTNTTIDEANALRATGVEIVAVAIGLADLSEVNGIADDPDEFHSFVSDSFDDLYYMSTKVIDTFCKGAWNNASSQGQFNLLSGYLMDETMTWKKSPALQLKSMEQNAAVFKSNFFGSFGFDLFGDSPELIRFDEVFTNFDQKIADNPYVLAVNCGLIAALIVGSVILRRFDKKDENQWQYKPLDDNPDDGDNIYFVSIHTGLWSQSFFMSTVYIIIEGSCGTTGVRALKAGPIQNLFRWKYSNFALETQGTLGPPISVKIWHDDPSARLHIDKILIADGYTGRRYVFLCDQWLAADRSDGCLHRTLYPAGEELRDGKTLFESVTRFNFFDEYLWLSLFGRPSFSRFSRVQRLYCISSLLSLSMLASAMWFNSENDKPSYGVKLGFFELNYKQIYVGLMSALISFPAAVIITMIFRNRRFRGESQNSWMSKYQTDLTFNSNKPSAALPWFTIFVAYGLATACIASGSFFTTLYSIQWGEDISKDWLVAIVFGAGNELALVEPIKTILMSIVLACLFKGLAKSSIAEMAPFQIDDSISIGAPAKFSHWPGDNEDSANKARLKKLRLLDRRLFTHFRGFLGNLLYIGVLVLICSHNVVHEANQQNAELIQLLKPLKKINKTADIWDWLNTRYADNVFPKTWYNGDPKLPPERKYMRDTTSYRMGPVRLRQLRVTGQCHIPEVMTKTMNVCRHEYKIEYEDIAGYCPGWTTYKGSCDGSGFTYISGNATSALPYTGDFGTYSGGGYVKDINPFKAEVTHEIQKLSTGRWIDEYTRFVVVENMVYNPNSQLFSLISIVFEFPATGGIYLTPKAQSSRLYPYVNVWDYIVLATQALFILITFVSLLLMVYDVWKLKFQCFTSITFLGKCLSNGFAVGAIVMYIIRIDRTIYIVEEIFNSAENFLSFEIVVFYDNIYKLCISVVLFVAILMLLKPLTFNYYLYMMKTSILVSKMDLLSFSVVLGVAMTAFACIVHLFIGATSFSFMTMAKSYLTLFRTLLAMVTLRELMGSSDKFESEIVFTIFIFTMTLILLNMFISILNDAFSFVKDGKSAGMVTPFDSDLNNHFWSKINQALNCNSNKKPDNPNPRGEGFSDLNGQIDSLSNILFSKSREETNEMTRIFNLMNRR
ncbi:polycystin-1-like protein 2 [Argopecten irradians]|uniref:polycystin-1-like protein 2 n=1 Tax=Argopecten irradians TaxID=31199 RepID=UPI003724AFA9